MKHIASCFLVNLWLLNAVALHAEEQTTEESSSPNFEYQVVFFQKDDANASVDYAWGVRKTGSSDGKWLFVGVASGWVEWNAATSKYNYKCLWSPDSKFVAVYIKDTRHTGGVTICRVEENKAEQVRIPETAQRIRVRSKAEVGFSKTEFRFDYIKPEVWLPDHDLLLTEEGALVDKEKETQWDYRFVLTIGVENQKGEKPAAKLKSFRLDQPAR